MVDGSLYLLIIGQFECDSFARSIIAMVDKQKQHDDDNDTEHLSYTCIHRTVSKNLLAYALKRCTWLVVNERARARVVGSICNMNILLWCGVCFCGISWNRVLYCLGLRTKRTAENLWSNVEWERQDKTRQDETRQTCSLLMLTHLKIESVFFSLLLFISLSSLVCCCCCPSYFIIIT